MIERPSYLNRRQFVQTSAVSSALVSATALNAAARTTANDKIIVGVMGVNGRGTALARGFAGKKDSEVAYLCDVDQRALDKAMKAISSAQSRIPQAVVDFRRMLDDSSVDAILIAAPNHWHAPATIAGCNAGKHVYVEKPCSHTPEEGELAVSAARKHQRVVQMGSQRRSRAPIIQGIQKVHAGEIGNVLYARSWYNNRRGTIGKGKQVAPPSHLDFDLWQGPAPRRSYKDNLVHYNWHWHWHWGNGELGNNGVHALDVARWGLQVDYPTHVCSSGQRARFQDDQETPDTHVVGFEFGNKSMLWEGLSWSPMGPGGSRFGISFHGDQGTLELFDSGYRIYDMQNKLKDEYSGAGGDAEHFADFISCIRTGDRPNADIEEGHKSTLLCHLGNIAHRVGRSLTTDPSNGHIQHDAEAAAMWSREYEKGWEPQVA